MASLAIARRDHFIALLHGVLDISGKLEITDLREANNHLENAKQDRDFAYQGWEKTKQDYRNLQDNFEALKKEDDAIHTNCQDSHAQAEYWKEKCDHLMAYVQSERRYVSASTSDFQPDAMSNPEAWKATHPDQNPSYIIQGNGNGNYVVTPSQ